VRAISGYGSQSAETAGTRSQSCLQNRVIAGPSVVFWLAARGPFTDEAATESYTADSIGCAVVWAVILIAVAATAATAKLHVHLLVFAGWTIGWASATIARYLYPPPKRRGVSARTFGV
jgi:hypothetical protein